MSKLFVRLLKVICIVALLALIVVGLRLGYKEMQGQQGGKKNVIVFYSNTIDDFGYGELREKLIEYLALGHYDVNVYEFYMQGVNGKGTIPFDEAFRQVPHPDAVLVNGDGALKAVMESSRKELRTLPVIFSEVHFPDMKKLRKHKNISGVVDTPDFWKNLKLIYTIFPKSVIESNYSYTLQGRLRHKELMRQIRTKPVSITYEDIPNHQYVDSTYKMCRDHNQISIDPNSIHLHFVPLTTMSGYGLVNHFKDIRTNIQHVFLMSKYEAMAATVCRFYNQPVFCAINKGFKASIGSVGGYFSSETQIARSWASLVNDKLEYGDNEQVIRDSPKSYHFDYNMMQVWNIKRNILPKRSEIVGMPWTIRYRTVIMMLGVLVVVVMMTILYVLYIIKTNATMQMRENRDLQRNIDSLLMSVNHSNIYLFNIDQNNTISFTGRNLTAKKSYSLEELRGLIHPVDYEKVLRQIKVLIPGDKGSFQIRVRVNRTESYVWYKARYGVYEIAGGHIICGLIEDISREKQHEEELIKSRDMAVLAESKQSFLDNLSHEIRTPLNAIVGFSNVLCGAEAKSLTEKDRKDMVGIINHNNDVLMSLIVDILELSRIESGLVKFKFAKVTINEILTAVYEAEIGRIKPTIDFRLELSLENPEIVTDALRVQEILHYIVGNANKFTDSGTIHIFTRYQPEINQIVIYVADTGCGIDNEQIKYIFERFYKTDIFVQGTGLGLSICDVIAKNLRGSISAFSKLGKGSTFAVNLPIHPVLHKDDE